MGAAPGANEARERRRGLEPRVEGERSHGGGDGEGEGEETAANAAPLQGLTDVQAALGKVQEILIFINLNCELLNLYLGLP